MEKYRRNNLLSKVATVDAIMAKWRKDITEDTLFRTPLVDIH